MRTRGRGVIVNVSSVAGRVGAPLNGLYAASKFALEALTETLTLEAGHFGVRAHIIEPGFIETPFAGNRRLVGAAAGAESPYTPLVEQWESISGRIIGPAGRTQPTVVAEAIVEAIEKGDKLRYPVGPDANMILMARRQMDDETFIATMRQQLGITW
jgi:NAD(P)-dependent dehydrogenase (short-subunit alcohol dehydrogenase family)